MHLRSHNGLGIEWEKCHQGRVILFPADPTECERSRFECLGAFSESNEDGILRPPFESIFDFIVTVATKTDTLVEFAFYLLPGSTVCAAETEVLLGGIKMVEGQGTVTAVVPAQKTAAALVFDAGSLQCKSMTVRHAGAAHFFCAAVPAFEFEDITTKTAL
jgi:hypothetical protein